MPPFAKELFDKRYYREELPELSVVTEMEALHSVPSDTVVSDLDENDQDDDLPLSDRDKFKIVMPILIKIGNLISCHPTQQFYSYLDDLNEFEKSVGRGLRYVKTTSNFTPEGHSISHATRTTMNDENETSPTSVDATGTVSSKTVVETLNVTNVETASNSSHAENANRFRSLSFKEGLKVKGRPKRKSKQVSFKRTSVDLKKKKKPRNQFKKLVNSISQKDPESSDGLSDPDEQLKESYISTSPELSLPVDEPDSSPELSLPVDEPDSYVFPATMNNMLYENAVPGLQYPAYIPDQSIFQQTLPIRNTYFQL